MPTKSITTLGAAPVSTPMRTAMPKDDYGEPLGSGLLKALEADLGAGPDFEEVKALLNFTDKHAAVMAPALETYQFIDDVVEQGHASIDVEGGATLQAVVSSMTIADHSGTTTTRIQIDSGSKTLSG